MSTNLLGTPYEQLAAILGDDAVPENYAVILATRCPRCGSGAGHRCRTASGGITYPHNDRIRDAVSTVVYFQKAMDRIARNQMGGTK